ncbi:MAG TPA: diguanylate cyclase [Lysobacter sp.]
MIAAATAASAQPLSVSRLDADPVPARVLSGEFDDRFVAMAAPPRIFETARQPRWWRLTATGDVSPIQAPQLVIQSPGLNRVEVWRPGEAMPVRRAMIGRDSDTRYSTRALVTALPDGLAKGDRLYLRVERLSSLPMPVSVESLAQVHRNDLAYTARRSGVLVAMLVLAILACGFWLGVGERSYALLMTALLAELCYMLSVGGELREVPWLANLIGNDPRAGRLLGLAALIASCSFIVQYLGLPQRARGLRRVFTVCIWAAGALMVATLVSQAYEIVILCNVLALVVAMIATGVALAGSWRRERPAQFLLLAMLPMLAVLVLRIGELFGYWSNPPWMVSAFPAAFAVAGLVLMIGLADKLQQLRLDHAHASRLASVDTLTGASSRSVIEQYLKSTVQEAHKSGRPLSLVIFDIDHFKRINDDHGHRIGDHCLRIIALRTRNRLRTYDLIGRYGGDEMLVILPDTRLGEALGVAENLRSAVNCRPLSIEGRLLQASLSLGVAELAAGESAEQLFERADAALYASKSAGRDRVTGDARVATQEALSGS